MRRMRRSLTRRRWQSHGGKSTISSSNKILKTLAINWWFTLNVIALLVAVVWLVVLFLAMQISAGCLAHTSLSSSSCEFDKYDCTKYDCYNEQILQQQ